MIITKFNKGNIIKPINNEKNLGVNHTAMVCGIKNGIFGDYVYDLITDNDVCFTAEMDLVDKLFTIHIA